MERPPEETAAAHSGGNRAWRIHIAGWRRPGRKGPILLGLTLLAWVAIVTQVWPWLWELGRISPANAQGRFSGMAEPLAGVPAGPDGRGMTLRGGMLSGAVYNLEGWVGPHTDSSPGAPSQSSAPGASGQANGAPSGGVSQANAGLDAPRLNGDLESTLAASETDGALLARVSSRDGAFTEAPLSPRILVLDSSLGSDGPHDPSADSTIDRNAAPPADEGPLPEDLLVQQGAHQEGLDAQNQGGHQEAIAAQNAPRPEAARASSNTPTPAAPQATGSPQEAVGRSATPPQGAGNAPEVPEIQYEEHLADGGPTRTPEALRTAPSPRVAAGLPTNAPIPIAVIIDDLGYSGPVSLKIARLQADVTLAVLPGGAYSRRVAELARETGKELMLHQPMEPQGYPRVRPGPGALLWGMGPERIREIMLANLAEFPEAVGVNNHMGSRLTTNARAMDEVMRICQEQDLYFVDSRTASGTVAFDKAVAHGVPRAARDLFIDNDRDEAAIRRQLDRLERHARRHGAAIGIGHPYPATLAALRSWLPRLASRNIEVVRASRLLGPPSARARFPGALPVVAQAP